MAVFQISRIQVRRGQINTGSGLPQLASGEFAWSIDTQELYIGNGSVAEGAPSVGNTRILSLNDLSAEGNLLSFLQYIYKNGDNSITTGPDANNPTVRGIQTKLDDFVSVADFGGSPDGVLNNSIDPLSGYTGTDNTAVLQRAIDQQFLNPINKASSNDGAATRNVLNLPAGVYITSKTLYIPSYSTLLGAGADKTIIYYNPVSTISGTATVNTPTLTTTAADADMIGAAITGSGIPSNTTIISVVAGTSITLSHAASSTVTGSFTVTLSGPAIRFVNDTSTIGNPSIIGSTQGVNQPREIKISGMTVLSQTGVNACLQLDAVRDSVFDNITLNGNWTNASPAPTCIGMLMQPATSLITCENNIFKDVKFTGFYYAVYAKGDILNNTFKDGFIFNSRQGFSLGDGANGTTDGQRTGPRQTTVDSYKFYNVKHHGVYIGMGSANLVSNSKFINVGNNGGGNTTAVYPQIYFSAFGNMSQNNESDRSNDLANNNLTVPYVPELSGHGVYNSYGTNTTTLTYTLSPVSAFRLPLSTTVDGVPSGSVVHELEYYYKSNASDFTRTGTILVSVDVDNRILQLSDEYNFAGVDADNSVAVKLDFSASFLDQNGAAYTGSLSQVPSSLSINFTNPQPGDTGNLNYSYKSTF